MWLQRFTNYILRHQWQALALTFVSTFVPVIGIVSILIAALVTLVKGAFKGMLFTIAATIPYCISFLVTGSKENAVPIVLWAAVGVAASSNILTYVFAVMLRRHAGWGAIFQTAALLGVLVISLVHLAYPEIADWWVTQIQSYYNQASAVTSTIKSTVTNVASINTSETQTEAINATKQYATGLMVAAVIFNAVLQLIFARWWQSLIFMPGKLRKELHGIRLSQLAGILFVAALVLAYLGNVVVLDIMPVLYLLFGAAGLSVMHYLFGLMSNSSNVWIWLVIIYITLIISLPVSVMMIALLALGDTLFDIRKRLRKV